jgi:hypothetical protein
MTTSPRGLPVSFDERIAEIIRRYPPDDPVHRAILAGRSDLAKSVGNDTVRRPCSPPGLRLPHGWRSLRRLRPEFGTQFCTQTLLIPEVGRPSVFGGDWRRSR